MDDSCAVCAETLEWVAYGPCGHRDVCSTCVARLRFICNDRRCCICKTESKIVFVTKALGEYTRMINDFSVLPSELREGQMGSYWYHEDTEAFFDDLDHYKMIKAMCRLSCSVCDKMDEQTNGGSKRRGRLRNIEQLKGHLFHRHRLLMCSLCLEGRKIFICEQKLYTRAQLNRHIETGDSEVDGTESERGGFMGHPVCEFCRTPFYGDNELYSHMSTEHYTCHICQRQHPGQYEYYKNYDDLEIHFRREHFLCEDEACLAKKFVVFQSEAEMKRHNTIEHGGRMSRSKRNAALQIPTSFRYRRNNEQDRRRGRGQTFRRDDSVNQLCMAIQASFETANADGTFHDPSSSSAIAPAVSDHVEANDIDPIIQPFESLTATDGEPPSRYLQALSHSSRNQPLQESSFPPLPMCPTNSQQKAKHDSEGLHKNTMAAHLRNKNNRKVAVISSAQDWPGTSRGTVASSTSANQLRPPTTNNPPLSAGNQTRPSTSNGPLPSRYASSLQAVHAQASGSSLSSLRNLGGDCKMSHSSSAPNLIASGSFDSSNSDFPPMSATQIQKSSNIKNQALPSMEDVHTANKSLVERMRAALEFDQEKYAAFRNISAEYRQGSMDTGTYLAYVQEYGLTHLIYDLARLLPDSEKQKELIETYNASLQSLQRNSDQVNGWDGGSIHWKGARSSKKGKGKHVGGEGSNSKDALADGIISAVRKLQSSYQPSEEDVEVLSKDGYRPSRGKSTVEASRADFNPASQPSTRIGGEPDQNLVNGSGGSKQKKKTSKFLRARLGDGSVAALMDHPDLDPDPDQLWETDGNKNPKEGLPVRGVWHKGGGQRLLGVAPRDARK
ncbi:uncharacterized protein LOC131155097 [Malania oleifera]|uniref:uncharacterized protein LOC131155097 n=1 Tax=Malania oleifera TaxID=397392 RepID=UPI0025AE6CE8|nr:uncharacterized protein LOC131155097 [Malania oleifera]